MMDIRRTTFSILALVYFISNIFAGGIVSNWVAQFIGQNDWGPFNRVMLPSIGLLAGVALGMIITRCRYVFPSWFEISLLVIGSASIALILSNILLLTSELFHLPQMAIQYLLIRAAFPRMSYVAFFMGLTCGVMDEWFQSFDDNRVLDLNDLLLNYIGVCIGAGLYWGFQKPSFISTNLSDNETSETLTP